MDAIKYGIENPKKFILGGKAYFTVESTKTGNHFTFKVDKIPDSDNGFFVSVCIEYDKYSYIGNLYSGKNPNDFTFRPRKKIVKTMNKGSGIAEYPKSILTFQYIVDNHMIKNCKPLINFYHHCKCAKCGRTLTTPESIKNGFGPVCIEL